MAEEIRKSGLTFQEAKNLVDVSIRDVKDGFVATGYYLWIIREERLWEEDGYSSFQEFLYCQYQKDKSWASRCISLYEKFGKQIPFGELPVLAAPYREYSLSQLIEMVSMTEEQREQVTPDMKVREIRELKPKRKKKGAVTLTEEAPAELVGEEPEKQLPGQMELTDYEENSCDVATGDPLDGKEVTGKCAYREGFSCTLTREQQKTVGGNGNCHAGCCWECPSREGCRLECISSASREAAAAEEEPLSAHGTPRKVYPEGSLIATAGCESVPGGVKGGYNCFSCAMECSIRQKERYCVEAPLGNPFPCDRMDVLGTLREAMGDNCQFVNPDLAYHSAGSGEPVPCCKECRAGCEFRCERAGQIASVRSETESGIEEKETGDPGREGGADRPKSGMDMPESGADRPKSGTESLKVKTYDRDLLLQMISNAEYEMKILGADWIQSGPKYYTQKAMEIQAYKSLLAEHDAEEAAASGPAENPESDQPKLPIMKNNDQRKAWLKDYKAWGLWYRDEHIDVDYYKFDFDNGSRLVVTVFPDREWNWGSNKSDYVYYHLIEKGKRKRDSIMVYDDKYQYHGICETELIEYLKKIQKAERLRSNEGTTEISGQ